MKRRDFLKMLGWPLERRLPLRACPPPRLPRINANWKLVTTWPKLSWAWYWRTTLCRSGNQCLWWQSDGEIICCWWTCPAIWKLWCRFNWCGRYVSRCGLLLARETQRRITFLRQSPLVSTANEIDAWINHGGGQALWDELSADFNVKCVLCGNTGVQMGGWFNKEINSLEDFKGLKIRMPGLGGEVLRKLGLRRWRYRVGKFSQACNLAIDAQNGLGHGMIWPLVFTKLQNITIGPAFMSPVLHSPLALIVAFGNPLTKSQQSLISNCALAENNRMFSEFNARNNTALETLINKHGVQFKCQTMSLNWEKTSGEVVADVGNVEL